MGRMKGLVAAVAVALLPLAVSAQQPQPQPVEADSVTRQNLLDKLRWIGQQDTVHTHPQSFPGDILRWCTQVMTGVGPGGTMQTETVCRDSFNCAGVTRELTLELAGGGIIKCGYTCSGQANAAGDCECTLNPNSHASCPR